VTVRVLLKPVLVLMELVFPSGPSSPNSPLYSETTHLDGTLDSKSLLVVGFSLMPDHQDRIRFSRSAATHSTLIFPFSSPFPLTSRAIVHAGFRHRLRLSDLILSTPIYGVMFGWSEGQAGSIAMSSCPFSLTAHPVLNKLDRQTTVYFHSRGIFLGTSRLLSHFRLTGDGVALLRTQFSSSTAFLLSALSRGPPPPVPADDSSRNFDPEAWRGLLIPAVDTFF